MYSTIPRPCLSNLTSPAGSPSFESCVCNSSKYLVAFDPVFGASATGNDITTYATNTLFIIRNPVLPQNSPLFGKKLASWTVTTSRACTIQPFWARTSVGWAGPTAEQNYNPYTLGTAVTVPSAGTYTFPWVTVWSVNPPLGPELKIDQPHQICFGWYTTEGINCVSSSISATGTQYLSIFTATGLPNWFKQGYYQRSGGLRGNYAVGLGLVPASVPSVMACINCEANYYRSSNLGCSACSPITTSPPGSGSVADCKCKPGYTDLCMMCPAGTYVSNGTCHTCANGSYCPIGSFSEKICFAGSYCPNTSSIVVCANGSYCPNGSTTERPCPAGSYCRTPATIAGCEQNFFCPLRSIKQNPCPENSSSLPGSGDFASCECNPSTYLLAYSSLFGVTSGYVGNDTRVVAANTLFVIRNPILPQFSPLFGTKIISWTVTTVKACTIQPFWTTPSKPWVVPTGEHNYLPWSVGVPVTVPSAGTYTFPWLVNVSGRGTDVLDMRGTNILDPTVMMNLGWYTTEGSNCVSSSFSAAGTQYLSIKTVSTLPAWWNEYYFQTLEGCRGISLLASITLPPLFRR